jgi:peroxiredoxin Q/BCP
MTKTADTRPGEGDAFPDFTLETPDGGTVSRDDMKGRQFVAFFYPKDDTPGCTTENKDFTQLAEAFADAGIALLGISKDPPAKHAKFIAKHDLKVPLASDTPADSGESGLAEALGIWVEKNMYGRTYMGMERTTYLVDAKGTITRVWRKVKVKGHAEDVLAAAKVG